MTTEADLTQEMRTCVKRWKWQFRFWIVFHFTIGSIAVLAPLAITAEFQSTVADGGLALIAACAAALVTFVRPDKYAYGFFAAFSHLEIVLKRFRYPDGEAPPNKMLIDAFELARSHIGNAQPANLDDE